MKEIDEKDGNVRKMWWMLLVLKVGEGNHEIGNAGSLWKLKKASKQIITRASRRNAAPLTP